MSTGLSLLTALVTSLFYALMQYALFCLILRKRFMVTRLLMGEVFFFLLYALTMLEVFGIKRNSLAIICLTLLANAGGMFAFFRFRGVRLLLYSAACFALSLLADLYGSALFMALMTPEQFDTLRAFTTFSGVMICNALPWTFYLLIMGGVLLLRRLRKGASISDEPYFRWARPVLLIIITVFTFGAAMQRIAILSSKDAFGEMLFNYMLCVLLLIISISYIVQDIQYLRQIRRNISLEQSKKVSDALLSSMRVFRHNIANMLYGFEGVILSGEPQELREYYEQIVRKCALINNENVIMLQNLPSPALTALMLRHIALAQEKSIPFYVYVQEGLRWRGLPPADTCQALGALLDNAREAAAACPTPYVSVEFRNVASALEIVVRNTWARPADGSGIDFSVSAKPGHEGIGLKSVRELLRKRRNCYLNLHTVGQYVQAQVLME